MLKINKPASFIIVFIVMVLLLPISVNAEEYAVSEEMKKQNEKIEILQQRIKDLEEREAERPDFSFENPNETEPKYGLNLVLYGDINYSTKSREMARNSFFLDEINLFSTQKLTDRLTVLSEIEIEAEDHNFEIDIERVWLGYALSDLMTIRGGKHHTALGYWNKEYHHAQHFYLTIGRPFFLNFEDKGGIIPTHITGLEFEGSYITSFMKFKYELEVGNGPEIDHVEKEIERNSISDNDNSKQVILRISGCSVKGCDMNIGVFGTSFSVETMMGVKFNENIYGLDLTYHHAGLELISEYFQLNNHEAISSASYAQIGYNVLENFIPYARYEVLNVNEDDLYLNSLAGYSRKQAIAGIHYDFDPIKSSIKIQYRRDSAQNDIAYDVFETQWSFRF